MMSDQFIEVCFLQSFFQFASELKTDRKSGILKLSGSRPHITNWRWLPNCKTTSVSVHIKPMKH